MVKLRYFKHYIIIKIGDVISQSFWWYGGGTRLLHGPYSLFEHGPCLCCWLLL